MTAPQILEVDAPGYPTALRRLPQPPPILHVRGRTGLLGLPGIAVIGTRTHSTYGRDATVSLVVGLVRAGYTIVSGLARGIDGIAHRTALEVGGDTVAVLGTGIDVAYPAEHDELFRAIAEHGCLVSEFPPGTPPHKWHFPRRNRIIAGLSRGVLVVEAPEKSGAMITAEYALEEGKEVFAVPGPIYNPTSQGTNRLIKEGAALVTCAADVLRIMESRTGEPLPEPLAAGLDIDELETRLECEPDAGASELARRVWGALDGAVRGVDDLAENLGAAPEALSAALLELELAGFVERRPGARYTRLQRPGSL